MPRNKSGFTFTLEIALQPVISFNTKDRETAILAGLGQAEEHRPQHSFGSGADWQQHLCKGEYVERDAAEQHDDSSLERERLEPCFYALQ